MAKYIDKITDEELKLLLGTVTMQMLYDNFDEDGGPIPPVMRGDNAILIRCKNCKGNELAAAILKAFPNSPLITAAYSMSQFELVRVSDYSIDILKVGENIDDRDETLFREFYSFMNQKFGEEYAEDFKKALEEEIEEEWAEEDNNGGKDENIR